MIKHCYEETDTPALYGRLTSPSVPAGPQGTPTFCGTDLIISPYSQHIVAQILSVYSVSVQRIELSFFLLYLTNFGRLTTGPGPQATWDFYYDISKYTTGRQHVAYSRGCVS